jgi:hypothetical protein
MLPSGYLYSQGVPEWLVGVCTGISSVFGVIGALVYPVLRSTFGLPSSAVIGFATLNILTSGAIVSAFLPGSPFEVSEDFRFRTFLFGSVCHGNLIAATSRIKHADFKLELQDLFDLLNDEPLTLS